MHLPRSASVIPAAAAVGTVLLAGAAATTPSAAVAQAAVSRPGNPAGHAYVPPAARAVSTADPTTVIGNGTPASCTSAAVVQAVANGGVITFSCGPQPVTITMTSTAKVVNTSMQVVLNGGGKVTLSGAGMRRILYLNACDRLQVWITNHCNDQATPQLTVENIAFADGNATGKDMTDGSGGAIYAEGGQLKVVNSRFPDNRCYPKGPDLGGGAIRALMQYQNRPVYIVNSTFTGGVCSNGGALSSIQVSWIVLDSVLSHNSAIGWGANPAQRGTAGGGSGGAIYNDGDDYTLTVSGSIINDNSAREGGGAIFFVSNNRTGTLRIQHSTLAADPSGVFHNYPGIFYLGHGKPVLIDAKLQS
jgi:hypothetical protein